MPLNQNINKDDNIHKRKDQLTLNYVECQNLISRILISKPNEIVYKFVSKLIKYRIQLMDILLFKDLINIIEMPCL